MRALNQNNRGSNERVTDAVDNDLNDTNNEANYTINEADEEQRRFRQGQIQRQGQRQGQGERQRQGQRQEPRQRTKRFISKKKKKPPIKTSEPLSSTGNDAGMYICKSFYTS